MLTCLGFFTKRSWKRALQWRERCFCGKAICDYYLDFAMEQI